MQTVLGMDDSRSVIVYFDGVCNLCNSAVDFIIRHDTEGVIRFASLQSESGQKVLQRLGLEAGELKTIVLEIDGSLYVKSEAALRIAGFLKGAISCLAWLRPLPLFLRDPVYMWISNNRYRWFGKKSSCRLPVGDEASRFID